MTNLPNSKQYDGEITQVHGPDEGPPDLIRYSAIAIDTMDNIILENHLPRRRISRGADVMAARVGDPCIIKVNPQAPVEADRVIMWAITEGIPFEDCGG